MGAITPETVPAAMQAIDPEILEKKVAHLSSDELRGRGTGTRSKEQAARWIAARFEEVGLEPVGESFLHPFELVLKRKIAAASVLTLNGPDGPIPHTDEETLTWWSTVPQTRVVVDGAPLVFVGHGVTAPEHGWDDFEGVDVQGKVLVFLNDDPRLSEDGMELFDGNRRTWYGRWPYKLEQAAARGAAGAIIVHTTPSAGYGWKVIGNYGQREHFSLASDAGAARLPVVAWMSRDLAAMLAGTVGQTLGDWFDAASTRGFEPVELPVSLDADASLEVGRRTTHNVLARLPGADPRIADEHVVFTAHYDHLGHAHDGTREDPIFNGAWDNASGTAAIMTVARAAATAEVAPRRSLLFFAVAGHERGLLGSRAFFADPPLPTSRLVANFNVDMPQIFGRTRDLVAIGRSKSELGDVLAAVASHFPVPGENGRTASLRIAGDPEPDKGYFYRSDQLHFARHGVPAIYFKPGTDYFSGPSTDPAAYRAAHYHQPSDELSEVWDLTGLARDMRVALLAAMTVANRDEAPRWTPGDEFEAAWKRLHDPS
jgi:Zn-dependent M28 family amino/carboxypeptidase